MRTAPTVAALALAALLASPAGAETIDDRLEVAAEQARGVPCVTAGAEALSGRYDPALLERGIAACGIDSDTVVVAQPNAVIGAVLRVERQGLLVTRLERAVEECRIDLVSTLTLEGRSRWVQDRLLITGWTRLVLQRIRQVGRQLAEGAPAPEGPALDAAMRRRAARMLEITGLDAIEGQSERALRYGASMVRSFPLLTPQIAQKLPGVAGA